MSNLLKIKKDIPIEYLAVRYKSGRSGVNLIKNVTLSQNKGCKNRIPIKLFANFDKRCFESVMITGPPVSGILVAVVINQHQLQSN